ncbi:MAG: hypothetical protein R3F60_10530 [bacterium]
MHAHRCPDEETLAAWFDGLLSPAAQDALCAELLGCPSCARLAAALGLVIEADTPAAFAAAPAVPAAVTRRALDLWPAEPAPAARALRLAVRWIQDRLSPLADALAPLPVAAGAMRGAASGPQDELHYQVRVGDLDLEIELGVDGPAHVALGVRPSSPPPAGLLLRLTAGGETCAMSSLTADGAVLDALPAGDYELCLERAGEALGQLSLSLGGD